MNQDRVDLRSHFNMSSDYLDFSVASRPASPGQGIYRVAPLEFSFNIFWASLASGLLGKAFTNFCNVLR